MGCGMARLTNDMALVRRSEIVVPGLVAWADPGYAGLD